MMTTRDHKYEGAAAFAVTHSNKTGSHSQGGRPMCGHCGKTGHVESECYELIHSVGMFEEVETTVVEEEQAEGEDEPTLAADVELHHQVVRSRMWCRLGGSPQLQQLQLRMGSLTPLCTDLHRNRYNGY